jgi:hypothetical protein
MGEETWYQTSKYFIQTSRLTTYYIRRSKNKKTYSSQNVRQFIVLLFAPAIPKRKELSYWMTEKSSCYLLWFSNHLTFCLSKSFEMDRLSIVDHGRQPWMDSGCRARMQGYISFCGGPGCCWIPFLFRQSSKGHSSRGKSYNIKKLFSIQNKKKLPPNWILIDSN